MSLVDLSGLRKVDQRDRTDAELNVGGADAFSAFTSVIRRERAVKDSGAPVPTPSF